MGTSCSHEQTEIKKDLQELQQKHPFVDTVALKKVGAGKYSPLFSKKDSFISVHPFFMDEYLVPKDR